MRYNKNTEFIFLHKEILFQEFKWNIVEYIRHLLALVMSAFVLNDGILNK